MVALDWVKNQQEAIMIEKINQSLSGLLNSDDNESIAERSQKAQDLRTALEDFEKQLLFDALEQNQGHRGKTAEMLGIDRKTLYTKLKKYEII